MVKSALEEDPIDSDPDPDYDPDMSLLDHSTIPAEITKSVDLPPQSPIILPAPRAGADGEVAESKLERDLVRRRTRFKKENKLPDFEYGTDDDF